MKKNGYAQKIETSIQVKSPADKLKASNVTKSQAKSYRYQIIHLFSLHKNDLYLYCPEIVFHNQNRKGRSPLCITKTATVAARSKLAQKTTNKHSNVKPSLGFEHRFEIRSR